MSTLRHKLLSFLTVVVVAVAQLAGLHSGWACECSGEPVAVTEQWCIGSDCHEHHPDDDHDHHHAPGEHEHQELRDSLKLVTAAPLTFAPLLLIECALPMPAELGIRLAAACVEEQMASRPWLEDPGGGRRQENYARRTAVLLI